MVNEEGSGKWVLVADHEDFWDESQRIYMPYIDTTALDQKTEEHISYAGKDMKIYDTVHYEAVRPEYTYKLVSELRDTATGEIVVDNAGKKQVITTGTNVTVLGTDGRLAQNSVVFTPESSAGRQGFRLRWIRGSSARKITTA